jgi:hypothetical protein
MSSTSDLEWFFSHSAAAMGVQSSFEPIRMAIMTGGASKTSMPDKMTDKKIEATHRHRKIHHKINAIRDPLHIETIHIAFQSRRWSDYLIGAFGRSTGVTQYSPAARQAYADDSQALTDDGFFVWLEGVVLRNEQDRIAVIRSESIRILDEALDAYRAADPH